MILILTRPCFGASQCTCWVYRRKSNGRYIYWTKLLATRNGQSWWSTIGCEGLYFHARYKNRVSVSGWSAIGCECFRTNLNIPYPLSHYFSLPLILSVTHIYVIHKFKCVLRILHTLYIYIYMFVCGYVENVQKNNELATGGCLGPSTSL